MKLIKIIITAFILTASSLVYAKDFTLLVTSFDPFGGSPTNNTQAIVKELKQIPLGSDVKIETCNLPVVYDEAAKMAEQCAVKYKADAVVSLGEAGCKMLIETAANNLDHAPNYPDNSGQVRVNKTILEGEPAKKGFKFPVQSMYCGINATSDMVSINPGNFVCNNTAFHLSHSLEALNTPFTFIHVPNSRCNTSDPKKNAELIAKMLKPAIERMKHAKPTTMPTTQLDTLQWILKLVRERAPTCEVLFAMAIYNSSAG